MDERTLLQLIHKAAGYVYMRWPLAIAWNDDDWADCRQAAAEGIARALNALQGRRAAYSYYERAARNAAVKWLWKEAFGRSIQAVALEHWSNGLECDREQPSSFLLSPDRKRVLWRIFSARKRNRWQEAATDMRIIEFLLDGVPVEEIARRLKLTPDALRKRRERIQDRLRRYVQLQQEDV